MTRPNPSPFAVFVTSVLTLALSLLSLFVWLGIRAGDWRYP